MIRRILRAIWPRLATLPTGERDCPACHVPSDVFDEMVRALRRVDPKCLVEYGAGESLKRALAELVELRGLVAQIAVQQAAAEALDGLRPN